MSNSAAQAVLAADLQAIYIGNLNTVDDDLTLPVEGQGGSVFTWETGESRFIDCEGKVHRPLHGMGNRKVTLTVIAAFEGETAQRVFEATVIQEGRENIVVWVRPIRVEVKPGDAIHLPSVAIVRCQDGRQISLPVTWDEIPAEHGDTFEVEGHLPESDAKVTAQVKICQEPARYDAPAKRLMEYVPLSKVRMLPGTTYWEYQQRMIEYLLAQDDDSMLYSFRAASGLDTKGAAPMTGWDAAECKLKGHTTGHYMSGLALAWAATGDERILAKIQYMLDSLQEVQTAFAASGKVHEGFFSAYDEEQFDLLEVYTKYPEIWAPYYTLDKIMCGLYDIYCNTGIELALKLESDLGDWTYNRLSRLPQAQLDRMWAMYIAGEIGAMLGTMVKLYEITKNEKHLATARLFYNEKLYYPMAENCDTLEDMHGNQHIPQAISAAEMFRATGEPEYWQIGKNFWDIVTGNHTYVNGGVGETEMFHAPNSTCRFLTEKAEESCASYNMCRLTGELFAYTGDAAMLDYYDNTLRNHILTSCSHTCDGGTTYFMPLNPGGQKEYSTEENTCCHGTGMESRFRYMGNLYAYDSEYVYVTMLVDSAADSEEMKLSQRTLENDSIQITVEKDMERGLRIHIPAWAAEKVTFEISGADGRIENGFLQIDGPVASGVTVIISLPMEMRVLTNPSDADLVNVAYGPWLLAALDESTEFRKVPGGLKRNGMEFTDGTVKMIPFNRVDLEKYHVYFRK